MDTGVLSRAHWSKLSLPHQETTCEEKSTKRLLLTLNGRLFAQRHQFGDVTFFCAGETGCETAHSEVLALRSGDFLQALLRWAQADAQAGTRRAVSLSSFTRPVLTALLQYFYTGSVSFEGPQDALDVLFAAHFALLDECCELTVNWLRANMAASETPDPATAQLCLYAAEQGLLPDGSSANSELKVAALKALLPVGKQLAEEAQAAVLEALGSCTLQERTALGFVEAVDARDGTPLTSSWSPTAQLLKSPRASESETLCVLNLRTADIHVNWVDCAGDELHYERERVKSHIPPGGMQIWKSYVCHMWRVYDMSSPASHTWLGGFAVGDLGLLCVSACVCGTLQQAVSQLWKSGVKVPDNVTQLVVVV